MRSPRFPLFLLLFALALVVHGHRAAARPADVDGWQGARWGMTEAALEGVFGDRLARLPGRWHYGNAYATRMIEEVSIGGQRFRAMLQMNATTRRLQQVLLETVRRPGQEEAFHSTLDSLRAAYGAPDGSCGVPRAGGGPLSLELWWTFPTTAVHLTFFDFFTRGMFATDPNVDPDPLADWFERRRNIPRFLPRRTLVRYHPADRADLMSNPCRDRG
jgi:hypothetical protein